MLYLENEHFFDLAVLPVEWMSGYSVPLSIHRGYCPKLLTEQIDAGTNIAAFQNDVNGDRNAGE